jgi:hypothetical protein
MKTQPTAPGLFKSDLYGVAGIGPVAANQARQTREAVVVRSHELGEGRVLRRVRKRVRARFRTTNGQALGRLPPSHSTVQNAGAPQMGQSVQSIWVATIIETELPGIPPVDRIAPVDLFSQAA